MITSSFLISRIYFDSRILILYGKHAQLEMSFELLLPRRHIITFLVNLEQLVPSRELKRMLLSVLEWKFLWAVSSCCVLKYTKMLNFFPLGYAKKLNLLGNLSYVPRNGMENRKTSCDSISPKPLQNLPVWLHMWACLCSLLLSVVFC